MNKPLISIIVPIYNAEKFLERCISSITTQTYTNLEIILINDGSTDNSIQICQKYKSLDKRIKVIDKKNTGVSNSRNLGVSLSTGEFISFCDSDDYLDRNFVNHLYNCLEKNNSEISCLKKYTILEDNINENQKVLDTSSALRGLLLLKIPTSCWAYMYSSVLVKKVKFNEEIHFFEDLLFNFEILKLTTFLALCYENLYHYTTNDNSINKSGLNDKRMTILDIKLDVNNVYNLEYEKFFFKAHGILSLMSAGIKSDKVEKNQTQKIKKYAKSVMKDKSNYRKLPIKYRLILRVSSLFPYVFVKLGNKMLIRGKNYGRN
ncbi:glycosyltransferase family 2 protein [Enterococcus casseliflavus]|uniref:glycosyltransferase family 2 protein n=1 Tax=Enterococcus casseliflavus TaxID=37734 RepID=UPI0037CAB74A